MESVRERENAYDARRLAAPGLSVMHCNGTKFAERTETTLFVYNRNYESGKRCLFDIADAGLLTWSP